MSFVFSLFFFFDSLLLRSFSCETSSLHTPHLRLLFRLVLFLRVLIELFCSLAFFLSLKQPLLLLVLLYGIGQGFNFNFCTDTHTSNLLVSLLLGLPYHTPALTLNYIFFFSVVLLYYGHLRRSFVFWRTGRCSACVCASHELHSTFSTDKEMETKRTHGTQISNYKNRESHKKKAFLRHLT